MTDPRVLVPVDVISDELAPPDGGFWTDESMFDPRRRVPGFRTSECASFFFGRSHQWLRQHQRAEHLVLDGELLVIPRDGRGHFLWRLCDVERGAWAMAQRGYLKVEQLERVIRIIKLVAQNYKYLLPSPVETRIVPNSDEVRRRAIMASETLTVIHDDTDGSSGAETRRFAIEDTHYCIDLTDKNWEEFLRLVQPYVAVAKPDRRLRRPSPEEIAERSLIRSWAESAGLEIGSRGRIPHTVIEKYREANKH